MNFTLKTQDVLHSFWIPQLGGKRDLITNHTNYLWFTPDSVGVDGVERLLRRVLRCVAREHALQGVHGDAGRVRAVGGASADARGVRRRGAPPPRPARRPATAAGRRDDRRREDGARRRNAQPLRRRHRRQVAADTAAAAAATVQQAGFVDFPRDKLPACDDPEDADCRPVSRSTTALAATPSADASCCRPDSGGCVGCHTINGNPMMMGVIGPNLTHVGTRTTIAAGLYPNDAKHLALWIKNARVMKPGVIMPTLGKGQFDPVTKAVVPDGTDRSSRSPTSWRTCRH